MYQLRGIGRIKNEMGSTIISLDAKYSKALKHLDKFSHVHVFFSYRNGQRWNLRKRIIQVESIDIKKGFIITKEKWDFSKECCLFDLKPYFPCEDTVKEVVNPQTEIKSEIEIVQTESDDIFEVEPMGMIRNVQGDMYIQLQEENVITGEYIKVYWWFHKFDSDLFRGVTECNPPYENAPRSGIFSTRSPIRPNPIAMTVVKIRYVDVEKKRVYISGIESFDKTPCLGISEYTTERDCVWECEVPEWLRHWPDFIEESDEQINTGDVTVKGSELELLLKENQTDSSFSLPEIKQNSKSINRHEIFVQGARENNLKGMNVVIPYGKITAVVGVSGSGKSSLVNDTIYAECRRRMEYLTHNRNLLQKPNVESVRGCIPAVMIKQEAIRGNSLSTVGTYTNAYDYLRVIYASVAIRHCPNCGNEILPLSRDRILALVQKQKNVEIFDLDRMKISGETMEETVDSALARGKGAFYIKLPKKDLLLLQTKEKCFRCNKLMFEMTPHTFSYIDSDSRCPMCNGTGKVVETDEKKIIEHPEISLLEGASSFYGKLRTFLDKPNANWMKGQVFGLADTMKENLEKPWKELSSEFREILLHGSGEKEVAFRYENKKNGRKGEITRPVEGICQIISRIYTDNPDTKTLDRYMSQIICKACNGERLGAEGRMATINQIRYPQSASLTFDEIVEFCNRLYLSFSESEMKQIENAVISLKEIAEAAVDLGIGYLSLNRETCTLSSGESQRVKLLGAFINHMSGVLYVFDEPSKGLHPNDYDKVEFMLKKLKEEGNTVIIVEHNEDMIRLADYIIEIGPGAGKQGGLLVGEGTLDAMLKHGGTQISKYMNAQKEQKIPYVKQDVKDLSFTKMERLSYRNLKNISIQFPQKAFTCICGVSGSGKSSLMKGEILNGAKKGKVYSEVILVDQLSIGKTSKSVIATYIGIMDFIRMEFSFTDQAVQNKYDEKYFSFNGESGQCATCKGEGKIKVKYLEDSYITCQDCNGKRYQKKILKVRYHNKNINEILNMSIDDAVLFWSDADEIALKLKALQKTGLGYLSLGQSTSSLSGGEAARLKLAKELVSKKKNNILYLLDEPTTGLHFLDVEHLLELISELVQSGNTIVAIEHNKQFIKNCDWVIELGPSAGKDGGQVMKQGGPEIF